MQDALKLGFFIQPVHPPSRPYADVLCEDREAVVLADEGFAIAESISEDDRFAILTENVRIGAGRRVDRLDEESELQSILHDGSPCPSASRKGPTCKSPRRRCRQGLVYELCQASVGAVLPDYDDYNASLLNSITSHAAHAITLDFTPQGNHTEWYSRPRVRSAA